MLKFKLGKNNPARLVYKNYLRLKNKNYSSLHSTITIDVFIPVVEKDIESLSLVLHYIKLNVLHPIGNIYIASASKVVQQFCENNNCIFLDEDLLLPIKKKDIQFNGVEWFRSGWLFQQLLKLGATDFVKNENVLILDADTFITTPQSFVTNNNNFILNFADEYHHPYDSFLKILPLKKRFFLSFICHHMLFNRVVINNLRNDIETFTGLNWIDAVLHSIDFNESCCFSEYELYGNYLQTKYSKNTQLEYWQNLAIKSKEVNQELIDQYLGRYKTVSVHKYM